MFKIGSHFVSSAAQNATGCGQGGKSDKTVIHLISQDNFIVIMKCSPARAFGQGIFAFKIKFFIF